MVLNIQSTVAAIAILALVSLGVGVGARAATTDDVLATVTAEFITISVADGSVAYGVLAVDTNEDTTASGVNNTQVVTNNSNVAVDLGVTSSDAIGGTDWNLVAAVGSPDEFEHEFCVTTCDGSPVWTTFNVDNTTYVSLGAGNIADSGGTQDFDLQIGTPTSVTDGAEKTITVTVLATQS